ncbi:MAG: hypothetical protein ABIS50_26310 [Luteolibacter sp.]|uniref:hypothetical protein n=1 Tax=Luteolibacter sp. TaxID=1962973 RepID=UPI0032678F9E
MNKKNRLAGRFLPSRVYARWKWTVRFGLGVVPLVLFLAGALALYLAPGRYRSTVVFEYVGTRPLPEVVELLKSNNVFEIADDSAEMSKRMGVSRGTAFESFSKRLEISVNAASRMIELKVTDVQKELARDLAAALPKALDSYESTLLSHTILAQVNVLENSLTDAGDEVELKRLNLARLLTIRGDQETDPAARLDVDAARRDWEDAHSRVLATQARIGETKLQLPNPGKWVIVHSIPQISDRPVSGETDETMGTVILQSLATGLALALLAPYLLELAFPRRSRRRPTASEKWTEFSGVPEQI